MFKLLKMLKDGFIQEVPPELHGCEVCREVDCISERAESCPYRLKAEKSMLASGIQKKVTPK